MSSKSFQGEAMRAVFFDRDGVINKDMGYVYREEDFTFYQDFFNFLLICKKESYKILVVTNQSGIDRGFYSVLDFLNISKIMQREIFKRCGFYMDRIYFCRFLDENNFYRKPNPGMILKAKEDFCLDLSQSFLIGDKISDMQAGQNAGVKNLFLLDRENSLNMQSLLKYNLDLKKIDTLDAKDIFQV